MMTFQINNVTQLTNDSVNDEINKNNLAYEMIVSIEILMNRTSNEQRVDIRCNESVKDEKESANIMIIARDESILLRDFDFNYKHVSRTRSEISQVRFRK
jgi:hypothetical protein